MSSWEWHTSTILCRPKANRLAVDRFCCWVQVHMRFPDQCWFCWPAWRVPILLDLCILAIWLSLKAGSLAQISQVTQSQAIENRSQAPEFFTLHVWKWFELNRDMHYLKITKRLSRHIYIFQPSVLQDSSRTLALAMRSLPARWSRKAYTNQFQHFNWEIDRSDLKDTADSQIQRFPTDVLLGRGAG